MLFFYKNSCLTVALILLTTGLTAQYQGGNADGHTNTAIIQVDLMGIPAGSQSLYVGGNGDGFDQQVFGGSVSGVPVNIFNGGLGDGFDQTINSVSLDGESLNGLYAGGNGDGFDLNVFVSTLDGTTINGLFGGGSGDGFDRNFVSLTLGGASISGLYAGGDGDGFDRFTFAGGLMGEMLSLYEGGDGDGFDQSSANFSLNGQSLAGLYTGGDGDGFDVSQYGGTVPLPLTLITFEAIPEATYVMLRWVTEDELDTDFFTIEKTREGSSFTYVDDVEAAGFSEPGETLHYSTRDEEPWNGSSFYRLKTTDFDGQVSLSHLVEVNYATEDDGRHRFELFPNPTTGRHFSLQLYGYRSDRLVNFTISGVGGVELANGEFYPEEGESMRFELPRKLSPGSYLIRLLSEDGAGETKILIVGD